MTLEYIEYIFDKNTYQWLCYIPSGLIRGTLNYECSWLFIVVVRRKVEGAEMIDQPESFAVSVTTDFWTVRTRILIDFEWISLWELRLEDGLRHSQRQRGWYSSTYCGPVQNPLACRDFERHKSPFQIFKTGPRGDSEFHNLKRNRLYQVFTTHILPWIRHGRFQERMGLSCQFLLMAGEEHFTDATLKNTKGWEGPLHRLGVRTKRRQGNTRKIIVFLWTCPVSTLVTTDAFNLNLQQVFHKRRVKSVNWLLSNIPIQSPFNYFILKSMIAFSHCACSKYYKGT